MLFGKRGIRAKTHCFAPFILLALTLAAALALASCSAPKGSIVILDGLNGVDFSADMTAWSAESTRQIALEKCDTLAVDITCEDGKIGLSIQSEGGAELYSGNSLPTMSFTVTATEAGAYALTLTGKNASGEVAVRFITAAEDGAAESESAGTP